MLGVARPCPRPGRPRCWSPTPRGRCSSTRASWRPSGRETRCSCRPSRESPFRRADAWCTCPVGGRWGWIPRPESWCSCPRSRWDGGASSRTRSGRSLPPGWTRTYLPGEVKADGPVLPQWAYTAAGWDGRRGGAVAWALHTDRRTHWDPERFSTAELKARVRRRARWRIPENRVLRQLETCALVYRCFTSQNVFYGRDEGALPVSTMCNAACVGLHLRAARGRTARLPRADGRRTERRGAGAGRRRPPPLGRATGDGELRAGLRGRAAHSLAASSPRRSGASGRRRTAGSLHINTNASLTAGLAALYDAGLDSIRVSLNSAVADLYEAYYQPDRYGWRDVEASIALSRQARGLPGAQPPDLPRRDRPRGRGGGAAAGSSGATGWTSCRRGACASIRSSTWRWLAGVAPAAGRWALPGCYRYCGTERPGCGWGTSPGDSANGESRPARLESVEPSPRGRPEGRF